MVTRGIEQRHQVVQHLLRDLPAQALALSLCIFLSGQSLLVWPRGLRPWRDRLLRLKLLMGSLVCYHDCTSVAASTRTKKNEAEVFSLSKGIK